LQSKQEICWCEFDFMARRKLNSPTSYDVAAHAGVSQAVVSRAFQPVAPISREAREKVLSSAKALGYLPNAVARSLITKRSGLVGVLLVEAMQRDTPDVLIFLAQALLQQGFHPLLFPCTQESDASAALDQALAFGVDGVVSCVGLSLDDLARARLRQRPMVLFNRHSGDPGVSEVACDHASAARLLASRLFSAGHRRFALVTGPRLAPVSDLRVNSFLRRLAELGVKKTVQIEGDYHYESGYGAALEIFAGAPHSHRKTRPEVVLCANDTMALGVLDAVRFALRLRVPQDVSVAGFDDILAGRRPAYLLTTVSQPFEEMARLAALQLRSQVDDDTVVPVRMLLAGKLIERGSAHLLPQSDAP
jgi:DNA-binding LacI/PurR family transcriptional regulator